MTEGGRYRRASRDLVSHHAHSVKTGLTVEENVVSVQEVAIDDVASRSPCGYASPRGVDR
jgi:hypothetical protein